MKRSAKIMKYGGAYI